MLKWRTAAQLHTSVCVCVCVYIYIYMCVYYFAVFFYVIFIWIFVISGQGSLLASGTTKPIRICHMLLGDEIGTAK